MKHIFLTGDIQIGKSTILQKVLSSASFKYGGFRTFFGSDRSSPERCLYIAQAGLPPAAGETQVIARFSGTAPPVAYPEQFNIYGAHYIQEALNNAHLILMDELGNFENGAVPFQTAVLRALEGKLPVLGTVKQSAVGWLDKIRSHPNVELITVHKDNRDELPEYIHNNLKSYLP